MSLRTVYPTPASLNTSRLLHAGSERDRLERVLLMLPTALDGFSVAGAAVLFGDAACELTGARVALTTLPELLDATVATGLDAALTMHRAEMTAAPWLAPAYSGELITVSDARHLGADGRRRCFGKTIDGRELLSILALPVRNRSGGCFGVMCLAHHRAAAFSQRQVGLALAIADYLGRAIEVIEAAREERRISTALQETLLPPKLPLIPGVEVSARYRPSGRGNLVGGDFYDLFPDGHGGWKLLIGDSSGIGPEAAGLAGIARYTARALADSSLSPGEMLGHLNRAILRAAPDDRFCTAVVAGFGAADGTLAVRLASAGHPPPYRVAADGTVTPALERTGLLLGVFDEAPVGEGELFLTPGEALVLYTDGVTEARDGNGEQFGEERLIEVLETSSGRSAEGIARRIELAVTDHRGALNSDDVAIVVLRLPEVEREAG